MNTLPTLCHAVWSLSVVCLLLAASPSFASSEAPASPPSPLQSYVNEALKNNAQLQAAEARWQMFTHKITPAESLADPRLSFGFSNYPVDSLASDVSPMTGNEVQLSQALPFPGKLALKGEVAAQKAAWYEATYRDQRGELVSKVQDAWYRLYYLDHALELVAGNLDVLDKLARLSETRFSVGKGQQQDVLRAQLQISKLTDRQIMLSRERETVKAQLNALLNRDGGELQTTLADETLPPLPDVASAIAGLQGKRPIFKAYSALVRQYQAQQKLAQRDYYPDFGIWAGYRFRNDNLPDGGEDFVSAGFSLNLPFYTAKRREAVADAEAGTAMAHQQYQDMYVRTVTALRDLHSQLENNRNQVQLYRSGIIPQAQQTFDADLSAYQVGRVTFLELMDSLSSLYKYQIDAYRAYADYQRAMARFAFTSGGDADTYRSDSTTTDHRTQP